MPRPLRNQRRKPRVPLRVWATLWHRGAAWRVETEDVGAGGCLIRSDRLLVAGLDARIVLQGSAVSDELTADGKVVWYEAPHAGIAFNARLFRSRATNAWFRRLLAADRRLALAAARSPSEIGLETRLFLPTPPRILDLRPEEALVVGCAEQGIPVHELLKRSGLPEERLGQVVFALLGKRILTLAAGEAGEAWKWRAALAAAGWEEASQRSEGPAVPSPPRDSHTPVLFPDPAAAAPPAQSSPPAPPPPTSGIPATAPHAPHGRYEPRTGATVMARLLRGVGSQVRPPDAEREFDRAREAEAAGHVADAIRLLRSALSMAPQDREIAGELARLAFLQPAR